MNTNTKAATTSAITLRTNPAKYANMHKCDDPRWVDSLTADWSVAQTEDVCTKSTNFVRDRLTKIAKAKAFKPENRKAAKELLAVLEAEAKAFAEGEKTADILAVYSFKCYQFERLMLRIWHRDTNAAREAVEPKPKTEAPAKQEKTKAPAKQESKPKAKKAPASQEVAKANEATFLASMTAEQKKELLLALMGELLK